MSEINLIIREPRVARIMFSNIDGTPRIDLIYRFIFCAKNHEDFMAKILRREKPSKERMRECGVELLNSLVSLTLEEFYDKVDKKIIKSPERHLGAAIPPSATVAAELAILYYQNKVDEADEIVRGALPSETTSNMQSANKQLTKN